jgi:hypothetical protein
VTPRKFTPRSSLQIAFKTASFSLGSESNCRFNFPRSVFRCVRALSPIVLDEAGVEVTRYAAVMHLIVRLADRYVNIMEAFHRTSRRPCKAIMSEEGWRRGELNPCPRRYPRKHLHVYPTINSEEPSHAPAHCRLPSVHKIDSRTGAVAPPIRQPAVHVCRRSRRPTTNVAVN